MLESVRPKRPLQSIRAHTYRSLCPVQHLSHHVTESKAEKRVKHAFKYGHPVFGSVYRDNSSLLNRYSLIIFVVGFATPLLISWIGYAPFMTSLYGKVSPWLVYPSMFGRRHTQSLPWLLGNAPTMGQFQYIAAFFILNFVLSAVGYTSIQPHPWGYNKSEEINAYIGYRTGEFGYALLPLDLGNSLSGEK